MFRTLLLTAMLAVFSVCAIAQTATGTIQGHVTDSSGAVIPEAKITIENEATGVSLTLLTNSSGNFSRSFMLPGNYQITAEKAGFAKYSTSHIRVDVDRAPNVEIQLKVGEISTTVEVTASGTLLSTSQATVSTVIDSKQLVDLPQNGRNPMGMARLVPGVEAQNGASTPWISGGRNGTSEITVDGTSIILPENNVSINTIGYMPVLDSVEELSVITNSLAAEYGRTGGGAINMATKGGTNALHGSAYDYLQNSVLNGNSWNNNKNGAKKSPYQSNTFGFVIGGPIYIPHLYNGKNRTFFFFSEQSTRNRNTASATGTVPIDAWRAGDFSQLKNGNGAAITVYDPNTVVDNGQNNGTGTRSAFPGNIVPQTRWDSIAKGMLKYWPSANNLANITNQYTFSNDFFVGGGKTASNDDKFDSRIDQNFGSKMRMFARGSYDYAIQHEFNPCGKDNLGCGFIQGGGGGGPNSGPQYNINTNWIYSFNPTTILNVNASWNHFNTRRVPTSEGVCPSSLGFDATYNAVASVQNCEFPNISVGGVSGLGQPTFTTLYYAPAAWVLKSDLTKSHGNHTIKFGGEFRLLIMNFTQLGQPDGQFSFNDTYTKQVTSAGTDTTKGFGFASFLLGTANSGSISHSFDIAETSRYFGFYVQDDWKVSSRLTLNLGMRYEADIPRTERYNRLSVFNINAPSPLPQLPATALANCPSCGNLTGAYSFVGGSNSRHQVPTDANNIGPRIGFAYRLDSGTVFRGAYAIMYAGSMLQAAGTSGSSGTEGFGSTTNMTTSFDSGEHLAATFSNPFPTGYNLPLGSKAGPASGALTNIGLGLSDSFFSDNANPMIQQWNASLQRELHGGVLVEAGYIGSKGNHLIDGENILYNAIPQQYQALGTGLNAQVPNPFNGVIQQTTSTYYNRATVALSNLLTPHPQYTGINAFRKPRANSVYHAFETKFQKRFSHGLTFLASFTGSKSIDDASTTVSFLGSNGSKQNPWNTHLDRSISTQDIPRVLVIDSIYELPFGKGKAWMGNAPKAVDFVLGGWQASGIYTYSTGQPLQISNGGNTTGIGGTLRPNNNGQSAKKSGAVGDRINAYFDTSVFSQAPNYTFGTTSRTSPDLRGPSQHSWDMSFFKTFRVHERASVRFEADMFNWMNHPIWGGPNTTVNATGANGFGTITSKNGNRTMQMVMRISF